MAYVDPISWQSGGQGSSNAQLTAVKSQLQAALAANARMRQSLQQSVSATGRPDPMMNSIDMDKEIRACLSKMGSWHVVRRYDTAQKCNCRLHLAPDGLVEREASSDCTLCDGKGYPFVEFPVRMAHVAQPIYSNLTASQMPAGPGTFDELGRYFIADINSQIRNSDVIFDVALDLQQNIVLPLRRLSRFDVTQSIDLRGDRLGSVDLLLIYSAEEEYIGDR